MNKKDKQHNLLSAISQLMLGIRSALKTLKLTASSEWSIASVINFY